jgi:endonuclease YncB( thermonuclease family)
VSSRVNILSVFGCFLALRLTAALSGPFTEVCLAASALSKNGAFRSGLVRRHLLCGLSALLVLPGCSSNHQTPPEARHRARVERIIDGDTLVLERGGKRDSYRLLAIDAPELSPSDHAERQARRFNVEKSLVRQLGKRSKQRLQELLPQSSEVEIEFDIKPLDKYQRPLIYLYLPGETRTLNEQLLAEGSAWYFNPSPNNRLARRLREASERSSRDGLGVWAWSKKRD